MSPISQATQSKREYINRSIKKKTILSYRLNNHLGGMKHN